MPTSIFLRPALALGLLLLLGSLFSAGSGGVNSGLLIEPGKQFVLGGSQPGAFKVVARNVGKVPVEFKERPRGGGIFGRAMLAPGQSATLRFMAGSSAVLLNPSAQQANVKLHITGDTRLSMGYEPNGK
ncbi:hypothetical protein [Hymenobacter glacieicola]|uniref:EfeO-type cupredoxin-like domain-containing protein n=1 Tax=Hymenobacter glacieicola TaxID=1562124 RepID=A0ABQ1WT86_9BACT|nr:hypothetical protein [Hymenobacter glacieicola]GGG41477.1 hypothetical protein GCM10011378_17200 [Hymenobacter glacieicola]